MKLLFEVEGVLNVPRGGCVITPEISPEMARDVRVKDRIQLRTPEGRVLDTHVALLFTRKPRGEDRFVAIGLADLSKSDVPIGTEVWYCKQPTASHLGAIT